MSTIAQSGLFPPIIDAWLPPVNIENMVSISGNGFDITFDYSPYNTLYEDDEFKIEEIQVTITRQSDYKSIFLDPYVRGIYLVDAPEPPSGSTISTIHIPKNVIDGDKVQYNTLYKVQLRLSTARYAGPTTGDSAAKAISDYLAEETNMLQFSEWSTVGAFSFIAPIDLEIAVNKNVIENISSTTTIDTSNVTLTCTNDKSNMDIIQNWCSEKNRIYLNKRSNDQEYLTEYSVKIYVNSEEVFTSELRPVNMNDRQHFVYDIPFYFENDITYNIQIQIFTVSGYTQNYSFAIQPQYDATSWGDSNNHLDEQLSLDTVIGKVNINFAKRPDPEGVTSIVGKGTIKIRRGSDIDNFGYWSTLFNKHIEDEEITETKFLDFNDFTIESGVLYKYEITYSPDIPVPPNTVIYTTVSNPVISVFDDAFLTGQDGKQLNVKFNPNVSNYKINTVDTVINTIGSQYPFVKRGAENYYRTFSLSGTIAYEMDSEHQFSSRTDIYGDNIEIYGTYLVNHYYNQRNDRLTQKKFREKVFKFLYDDKPKLFRSTPEGNILVRLTDISYTPSNNLGRMIGEFSCTATEIGEPTVENLILYDIIKLE